MEMLLEQVRAGKIWSKNASEQFTFCYFLLTVPIFSILPILYCIPFFFSFLLYFFPSSPYQICIWSPSANQIPPNSLAHPDSRLSPRAQSSIQFPSTYGQTLTTNPFHANRWVLKLYKEFGDSGIRVVFRLIFGTTKQGIMHYRKKISFRCYIAVVCTRRGTAKPEGSSIKLALLMA